MCEENYKSEYGAFNQYQEALLLYGRSKKALIYLTLHSLTLLLSFVSIILILTVDLTIMRGWRVSDLNLLKIVLVFTFLLAFLKTLGIFFIYQGSVIFKVDIIKKGLKIIKIFLIIILGLIVLSAVFAAVTITNHFFIYFNEALVYGVILTGIYWFYIKYYKKQILFVKKCWITLSQSDSKDDCRPHPMSLSNYLIFSIILMLISRIYIEFSTIFSTRRRLPFVYPATLDAFQNIIVLYPIIIIFQIIIMFYTLYLLNDFYRHLNKAYTGFEHIEIIHGIYTK